MEASELHTTPQKVLTVLREGGSADAVKPKTNTLATLNTPADLATHRKRIMEHRSVEDEERAKARKIENLVGRTDYRILPYCTT